jgi:hypothetical protein
MPQFRSVGRLERRMSNRPNANSAKRNRKTHVPALSDEDLIKQLKAAIDSEEICEKALDVIHQRIASGEVSDNNLLRILVSLSKSAAGL